MRRFGGMFPQVVTFHNLVSAGRRAAKGKGRSPEVANFIRNLEPESLALQRELQGGEYRPGRYTTFVITDPKVRQITVAPFRDRVVHHAISGAMEPCFERIFMQNSFACRKVSHGRRIMPLGRLVASIFWVKIVPEAN